MATSTYDYDNASIAFYGRTAVSTVVTMNAKSSQCWFRVKGTQLEVNCRAAGAGGVRVSVDGGAPTTPTITTAATPAYATFFTGLSDDWHDVELITANGGFETTLKFALSGMLRVTGSAPDIDSHSDSGDYELLGSSNFSTYGDHSYTLTTTVANYSSPASLIEQRGSQFARNNSIRRVATWELGARLLVWQGGYYNIATTVRFQLRIDGIAWASSTLFKQFQSDASYGFLYIDLPLSGKHEIEIIGLNQPDAIMIRGGTWTAETVAEKTKQRFLIHGDSMTEGTTGYSGQKTFHVFDSVASLLVDGFCVNTGKSGDTIAQIASLISTNVVSTDPEFFILHAGYNDVSGASFETDYSALLDETIAQLPDLTYLFVLDLNDGAGADIPNRNVNISNAVSSWLSSNPSWSSKLIHIDSETWGGGTEAFTSGHLNALGYAQCVGENVCVASFSGNPSDGDTLTLTAGGTAKVFEFDSNASVAGSNILVTIGASTAATTLALMEAIVTEYLSGWNGRPLERVAIAGGDFISLCDLSDITESSTVITTTGPFSDGLATTLKQYLGEWPPASPSTTGSSNSVASSVASSVARSVARGVAG